MAGERAADLAGELADLGDERRQRGDQAQDGAAARVALEFAERGVGAERSRASSASGVLRPL